MVKFGRGSPSVTIGQFFSVQGGHHATKHVFAGTERIASKLIPVAEQVALWQGGGGPTSSSPLPCATTGTVATGGCRVASLTAPPSQAHGALRSETYYYHPDHLGSTSWMTDHEGRVHEHVEYYPYGEVWRDSRRDDDAGPQPRTPAYLFTSKEYDPETRLYYYGARYYDPRTSLWQSADPMFGKYVPDGGHADRLPGMGGVYAPLNMNLYAYALMNPLRYTDPDGREVFRIPFTQTYVYVGFDSGHFRVAATTLQSVESRHPKLSETTPELKPFLRDVIMRQELKGFKPIIHGTTRTVAQSAAKVKEGDSGLADPKASKHINLGRGADAADIVDTRYFWGAAPGTAKGAADYFKTQGESFEEAKTEFGEGGKRFTWGGYWTTFYDPAHIENSKRVRPPPPKKESSDK